MNYTCRLQHCPLVASLCQLLAWTVCRPSPRAVMRRLDLLISHHPAPVRSGKSQTIPINITLNVIKHLIQPYQAVKECRPLSLWGCHLWMRIGWSFCSPFLVLSWASGLHDKTNRCMGLRSCVHTQGEEEPTEHPRGSYLFP